MHPDSPVYRFARYNYWANKKLTDWLKTIESEKLYVKFPSSYSSIDATLQHMHHAQRFWMAVLNKTELSTLRDTVFKDVETVMDGLLSASWELTSIVGEYSDQDLQEKITNGVSLQTRYDFILHVINHNSYHRGQIITIAHNLGIAGNIPNTDYEFFLSSDL